MARAKLNISLITDEEAAQRLLTTLSALNFSHDDKQIVIPPPPEGGGSIVYKLSDVSEHVKAWLAGKKDDVIAIHEIKYAKKEIAYERAHGGQTRLG